MHIYAYIYIGTMHYVGTYMQYSISKPNQRQLPKHRGVSL